MIGGGGTGAVAVEVDEPEELLVGELLEASRKMKRERAAGDGGLTPSEDGAVDDGPRQQMNRRPFVDVEALGRDVEARHFFEGPGSVAGDQGGRDVAALTARDRELERS